MKPTYKQLKQNQHIKLTQVNKKTKPKYNHIKTTQTQKQPIKLSNQTIQLTNPLQILNTTQ